MNTLFAAGDVVVRVGRPTADPAAAVELAAVLDRHGVRVPRYVRSEPVVEGDLAAWAIERIEPDGPIDWSAVGSLVARVHTISVDDVPAGYPVPPCTSFPWWDFDAVLADVGPDLDPAARRGIDAAIDRAGDWRQAGLPASLCHGDVHPGNVLQTDRGPVLLDWDLACHGVGAWDHAPLMTWTARWGGEAGIYERFAAGYGRSFRADPLGEALAELRLVSATLMRVRAGRTDPAAAGEAERRLRWWRGDADAPAWRAM
jgi:Ser/Thr protein kinase RdoA (MazF antagonist)